MAKTTIEWTEHNWQVTRGCTRVSPGCGGATGVGGCYAEKIAGRFSGPGKPFEGFAKIGPNGARWTGKVAPLPHNLTEPLRRRKPTTYFVNSMSDLFHEDVPDEYIASVFGVMAACPQHTFQVLTKRAERMAQWFRWAESLPAPESPSPWPLPNVWLGVSVEDQKRKARIDDLRLVPATIRFLSLEPLLENLGDLDLRGIHWVIVGGESGPGARPCCLASVYDIVAQCRAAGVACFVKQLGAWPVDCAEDLTPDEDDSRRLRLRSKKGGDPSEWPADLRVREFPEARP